MSGFEGHDDCEHDLKLDIKELGEEFDVLCQEHGAVFKRQINQSAEGLIHMTDQYTGRLRAILDPAVQSGVLGCVAVLATLSHAMYHRASESNHPAGLVGAEIFRAMEGLTQEMGYALSAAIRKAEE